MMRRLKVILTFPGAILLMFVTHLPGEAGIILRRIYWKRKLLFLGARVRIDPGIYFQHPEFIRLEDGAWIDRGVMILAGPDSSDRERIRLPNPQFVGEPGVVRIGKNVHVAPGCLISGISAGVYIADDCGFSAGCKIYAFSHHFRSKKHPEDARYHFGPGVADDRQCLVEGPVQLGENTGLALNVVILPGVSIPENCFVTIGSVVHRGRFSPNSMLSGNPAKPVGPRFIEMPRAESATTTAPTAAEVA